MFQSYLKIIFIFSSIFISNAIVCLTEAFAMQMRMQQASANEMTLEKAQTLMEGYNTRTPEEQAKIKMTILPFMYSKVNSSGSIKEEEYIILLDLAATIGSDRIITQIKERQQREEKAKQPSIRTPEQEEELKKQQEIRRQQEEVERQKRDAQLKREEFQKKFSPETTIPISIDNQVNMKYYLDDLTQKSLEEMKVFIKNATPVFAPEGESQIPNKIHFIWLGGPIPEGYWRNIKKIALIGQNGKTREEKFTIHVWVENPENIKKIKTKQIIREKEGVRIVSPSTIIPNEELYVNKKNVNGDIVTVPLVQIRDINDVKETIMKLFPMGRGEFSDNINPGKYIWSLIATEMVGLKNYASAADYLRLMILYKEGGMYLDTDTEALGEDIKVDRDESMRFNFYRDNGISDKLGNPLGYVFNFKIQNNLAEDNSHFTIGYYQTNNAIIVSSPQNLIMKALIYKTFNNYFDMFYESYENSFDPDMSIQKKRHLWKNKYKMATITGHIALSAAEFILNMIESYVKKSPSDNKICQFYQKNETCVDDVVRLLTVPGMKGGPVRIGSVELLHMHAFEWGKTKAKTLPKSFSEENLKNPVSPLD